VAAWVLASVTLPVAVPAPAETVPLVALTAELIG